MAFLHYVFYSASFLILKKLLRIPRKNFGAFTTTIFITFTPFYFFTRKQVPAPIRHRPSMVIKRYLGIAYAKNNPTPMAIKNSPVPLNLLGQQHLLFLNILTTIPFVFSIFCTTKLVTK